MSNKSVHIVAKIFAQADKAAEVREILLTLVEPTRKEEGCISYKLLENNNDPTDFTFVEEWANDQAIDAHFTMPYVQSALSKVPALAAKPPEIHRYSLLK